MGIGIKSKEYSNGEITVVWQADKCIHAGECVKRLPQVYKPKERPWITVENASTEELKEQINACPSGALTFYMNNEEGDTNDAPLNLNVVENGPVLVMGNCEITLPDGTVEIKENRTALCRCGASANKPYCDGAHKRIEFKG